MSAPPPGHAAPPPMDGDSRIPLPPVARERLVSVLQRAHALMLDWRDTSPSAQDAVAFIEGARHLAPEFWRDVAQCGVVPFPPNPHTPSAILTAALAKQAGTRQAAADELHAACVAGLIRPQMWRAAQADPKWSKLSPAERAERFLELTRTKQNATDWYWDLPRIDDLSSSPVETVRGPEFPKICGHFVSVPVHVRDDSGQLVIGGFAFRSLRDIAATGKDGRHRMTASNPLLRTTGMLWGLAEHDAELRAGKAAVIVEGTMDRLAVWAAHRAHPDQVPPPLAARGAVMSAEQVAQVAAMGVERVLLMTDSDDAGVRATVAMSKQFAQVGIPAYVWRHGSDTTRKVDPSDVYSAGGADALASAVTEGWNRPFPLVAIERERARQMADARFSTDRNRHAALEMSVAPALADWPGEVPAQWIEQASVELQFAPSTIALALSHAAQKSGATHRRTQAPTADPGPVPQRIPLTVPRSGSRR